MWQKILTGNYYYQLLFYDVLKINLFRNNWKNMNLFAKKSFNRKEKNLTWHLEELFQKINNNSSNIPKKHKTMHPKKKNNWQA